MEDMTATWFDLIDKSAAPANETTHRMMLLWDAHQRVRRDHQDSPDPLLGAVVALVAQVAYANTIAAGEFYLRHAGEPDA